MTHEAWLALRRSGLGGSDIGAVAGLNRYRTAFHVYLDKLGLAPARPQTPAMQLGLAIEPVAEALYCHARQLPYPLAHPGLLIDRAEPWRRGTPDGLAPQTALGVDYKYSGGWGAQRWGTPGTDEVPLDYLAQCHWYMLLTGYRQWDLAVIIGSEPAVAAWALAMLAQGAITPEAVAALARAVDFRLYPLTYDEELAQLLLAEARRFWHHHVVARQPPPLDGSETTLAYLQTRYPQVTAPVRRATTQEQPWLAAYHDAKTQAEAWTQEQQRAEALLKDAIGPARGLRDDAFEATWTRVNGRTVVDWEGLARALGATPAQIVAYTQQREGTRRFQVRALSRKE